MLGIDLSRELGARYDVAGMDVVHSPWSIVDSFYEGDIADKKNVADVIARAQPDIVIHAAAWTDVDGCELDPGKAYAVNAEGTKNIAAACKGSGAVLIYISTDFVFDGKKKGPYKESDAVAPLSVYGDSKLKGEKAVRDTLEKYYILRTSWLYGTRGKNFVDTIAAGAKAGKALKVVDDQVGSPTYTKDLAKAIHAFLKRITSHSGLQGAKAGAGEPPRHAGDNGRGRRATSHGIYHVSNAGKVSWYDYAVEILKLAKLKTKVAPIASAELNRPAKRPAMSVMDNTKFRKFTGYRMRGWTAALKEYLLSGG